MKKVILSLILVFTALCVSAQTTFQVGTLEYFNYSGTDVTCTGLAESASNVTDITVPATVTYDGTQYTVRRISSNAFTGNTTLRNLTILSTQMEPSEYACYSGMSNSFHCYVDIGKYFDVRHSLLKANRKADEAQLLPFVCNPVGQWITLSQVYFWDGNDGLYENPSISFENIINNGGKLFEVAAQDIQVDNGYGQLELLEIDPKMGLGLPSETGLVAKLKPGKVYRLSRIDEDTYIGSRSLLPTAMTLYEDPYCFPYPINYGTDRDPYTYELDETANTPTFVKVTAKSRTNNPGHAYLSLRNAGISINDLPAEIKGIYLAPLQPYVELSNDSTTITFYYDELRYMRSGTTYNLNDYRIWLEGLNGRWDFSPYSYRPDWIKDSIVKRVEHVVFDASFKDARPETTSTWFKGMANLKTITGMKENLNTSEVYFMDEMFSGCSSLESIDVSGFITDSTCDFYGMFKECSSLKSVDISSFDIYLHYFWKGESQNLVESSQLLRIGGMFSGCSALKTIYDHNRKPAWGFGPEPYKEGNLFDGVEMFSGCTSLVGGAGTVYDESHTDGSYFHIDGGPDNPGYTTLKIRGDVNGDGTVGIGDIVAVTNVMAGIETDPDIVIRAHVNDDEDVGIGDIVAITNIMAGIGGESEKPDDKTYLTCPNDHHPHIIDLGLPSGTLWACCNVGASAPEGYGDHYAWGETNPKSVYNWDNYHYGYYNYDYDYRYLANIGSDIAGTSYDAATANWGAPWRMPSSTQIKELLNNCTSIWTTQNGVDGRKFTGPYGNTIFLPAAGYRWDGELNSAGSHGYYWSSTLDASHPSGACSLHFYSGSAEWGNMYRSYGRTVRPVR